MPAEKVLSHFFGKKKKISKLVLIQYEPTNIYETNLKIAKLRENSDKDNSRETSSYLIC